MPKASDIPQLIECNGSLGHHVNWGHVLRKLDEWSKECKLDLDPDFQRAHVWTEAQQIAYIEFCLKGGKTARELYFNCHGYYQGLVTHPLELVDGKQRLTALIKFLSNELPVFGYTLKEYDDWEVILRKEHHHFYINDLPTREEVLKWYLQINDGGTPHTPDEINKVKLMLAEVNPDDVLKCAIHKVPIQKAGRFSYCPKCDF